jgi:hypothetical protein
MTSTHTRTHTVAPLCFIDTETTGVHPGRLAWEIAMIRRDGAGQFEWLYQVNPIDLSNADPFGLQIGGFYERHFSIRSQWVQEHSDITMIRDEKEVVRVVEEVTRGAHLVGAVPSFDAATLDPMLRRHGLIPAWHYHVIDVEALAVGYLSQRPDALDATRWAPPWNSEDLSRACGVEPAGEGERHTALGDARWAMRLYDAILGGDA